MEIIGLLSISVVKGGDLPCNMMRGNCRAQIDKFDGLTELKVSCLCKYPVDVSEELVYLTPIRCPLIPQDDDSPRLNRTILTIENCNILKEEFPVEILRVLRRSYNLTIMVKNSSPLRLDKDDIQCSEDMNHPVVNAKFISSKVPGLFRGWFTASNDMNLVIQNCTVNVIDSQFIDCRHPDAKVNVTIENTELKTVHNLAFGLPVNGRLSVTGGKIRQLESDAIRGGKEVSLEGVLIESMQKRSINVYGLQKFNMDSCIVARINEEAFAEDSMLQGPKPPLSSQFYVGEMSIKSNKFINASPEAFASLCMEEKLIFENNFFKQISSAPALKLQYCSVDRDWWSSVSNNGFSCNKCQNLFEKEEENEKENEQVCAVYETGWCLCDQFSHPDSWNSSNTYENGDKVPCRISIRNYISQTCEGDRRAQKYISYCDQFSEKVPKHPCSLGCTGSFSSGSKPVGISISCNLIILCSVVTLSAYLLG